MKALVRAFQKRLVDDHFPAHIREFTPLPCVYFFRIGLKLHCFRSTPTETQSIRENDFECLAKAGVYARGTTFPSIVTSCDFDRGIASLGQHDFARARLEANLSIADFSSK